MAFLWIDGMIDQARTKGVIITGEQDYRRLYGGHRLLLELPEWQEPTTDVARRIRYWVYPRITVEAGQTLNLSIARHGDPFGEGLVVQYAGPLINVEGTPPLCVDLITSPTGYKIGACDAAQLPFTTRATNWRVLAVNDIRGDDSVIHGFRVMQLHDHVYLDGIDTLDCGVVEQTDRVLATCEAQQYDFVDSWGGQAVVAHTLNRLAYEDHCSIYAPLHDDTIVA